MKFRLAHLSDPHLGPLPHGAAWRDFALKRLIGGVSWHVKRKGRYLRQISDSLIADIATQHPDHIAMTGDVINIAAHDEFPAAARWLQNLGAPDTVTFVPGNHDCYVPVPYSTGLSHFESYMQGDLKLVPPLLHIGGTTAFPFVKLRRNIALIGLSSALPQALHRASGELGQVQLDALAELLPNLRRKGYCRVVLIHHPPLEEQASKRRGLNDAPRLERILKEHGAELVLHGHNHVRSLVYLESQHSAIPISGAPCASLKPSKHHEGAGWTMFTIDRIKGAWIIEAEERNWDAREHAMVASNAYAISRSA